MSDYETRAVTNEERFTVILYGFLVFIAGGGVGVYFPLFVDREISSESLATYAIAALFPLIADIFIPENYWKELSIFGRMKLGAVSAIGVICAMAALFRNEKSYDMVFAVTGTIAILYLLYRICILSGKFQPKSPPGTEDGGAAATSDKLNGQGLPNVSR
jgi:hypothetical protein